MPDSQSGGASSNLAGGSGEFNALLVRECIVGASWVGCPVIHRPQFLGPRGKRKGLLVRIQRSPLVWFEKKGDDRC